MSEIKASSLLTQRQASIAFLKQSLRQEAQVAALVEQAVDRVEDSQNAPAANGRLVDIVI